MWRKLVLCTLSLAAVLACNGLRSGPIGNESPPPADGGNNETEGGSASGNLSDGAVDPDGGINNGIDADIDPDWAMTTLPVPLPPANNYSIADGVVKDEVTGLRWMQTSLPPQSHDEAAAACATSTLGGVGPGIWRLPTRSELLSITFYSEKGINQDVFVGPFKDAPYWTSTPDAVNSPFFWYVRFGLSGATTDDPSATKNVRCVQGPPLVTSKTKPGAPRGHYIFRSAAVVYDVRTKLEWMRQPGNAAPVSFEVALNTCAGSMLEGTQWRVPTARELETIYDVRAAIVAPAWDLEAFGNQTPADPIYWTLTELLDLPTPFTHLGVDFRRSISTTLLTNTTSQAFVRCVRGPK